jgi:hypothetical protein
MFTNFIKSLNKKNKNCKLEVKEEKNKIQRSYSWSF